MSDLHIVTVATESKYYFPYLVESCKRHGKELKVLGYGEKWEGFNWKFKKMIEYLKSLPLNDIVCFVDGYDVLCVRDLHEIKTEFMRIKEKHKCKIIVAEDKQDNFLFEYIGRVLFDNCKEKNVNSGTYIGHVSDILDILNQIHKKNSDNKGDDQILLTEHCKNNSHIFHIDEKNEFFFTKVAFFNEIDSKVTINDNNCVIANDNKPFFLHAPSGFLDNVIIKLGYDYDHDNKIKDKLMIEIFTEKVWKSVFANYIYYFLYLILFIILIYLLIRFKIFNMKYIKFIVKNIFYTK